MSAKSLPSQSTPRSSSQPDKLAEGVQAILELRAEKQKYKELQRLLTQGLDTLRKQQEAAEQAEFKFRKALRDITDISVEVNMFFNDMTDAFNRFRRFLGAPFVLSMKRPDQMSYTERKYRLWLMHSIAHHRQAMEILCKTLESLDDDLDESDMSDIAPSQDQRR